MTSSVSKLSFYDSITSAVSDFTHRVLTVASSTRPSDAYKVVVVDAPSTHDSDDGDNSDSEEDGGCGGIFNNTDSPLELLPLSADVSDERISVSLDRTKIPINTVKALVDRDVSSPLSSPVLLLAWAQSGKTMIMFNIVRAIQILSLRVAVPKRNVFVFFTHARISNAKQISLRAAKIFGLHESRICELHSDAKGVINTPEVIGVNLLRNKIDAIVACGTPAQYARVQLGIKSMIETAGEFKLSLDSLPTFTFIIDEAERAPMVFSDPEIETLLSGGGGPKIKVFEWLEALKMRFPAEMIVGRFMLTATPDTKGLFGASPRPAQNLSVIVPSSPAGYRRVSAATFKRSSADSIISAGKPKKLKPVAFIDSVVSEHYSGASDELFATPGNKFFIVFGKTTTASHLALRNKYDSKVPNLVSLIINVTGSKVYFPKNTTAVVLDTKKFEVPEALHALMVERGLIKADEHVTMRHHVGVFGRSCLGVGMTLCDPKLTGPITHIVTPYDKPGSIKDAAALRLQQAARGACIIIDGVGVIPPLVVLCSRSTRQAIATQDHIADVVSARTVDGIAVMTIEELSAASVTPDGEDPDTHYGLRVEGLSGGYARANECVRKMHGIEDDSVVVECDFTDKISSCKTIFAAGNESVFVKDHNNVNADPSQIFCSSDLKIKCRVFDTAENAVNHCKNNLVMTQDSKRIKAGRAFNIRPGVSTVSNSKYFTGTLKTPVFYSFSHYLESSSYTSKECPVRLMPSAGGSWTLVWADGLCVEKK